MNKTPLYQEIAESIRMEIIHGTLHAEDELPTVREMAEKWSCAPGTVLRAYQELAEQGLVVSRPGAGTHVTEALSTPIQSPLRKATLINSTESFLLKALSSGYSINEIEPAFHTALDRYRQITSDPDPNENTARFMGSHDPIISLLTKLLTEQNPGWQFNINFAGSLGGLIALARGEADFAGSHLWDEETDSYNTPYICRLFPGKRIALVHLAERRIGLITAPGNPLSIDSLQSLIQNGIRFINRQHGAGTRVWLDAQLRRLNIHTEDITGYQTEVLTHTEVAKAVHDERADTGLGIESAAIAFELGFFPLGSEKYDLVVPESKWEHPIIQAILKLLSNPNIKADIQNMGGYDLETCGTVDWVS